MRVLMVGWELPPHNSGGLGNACFGLCESLAGRGTDITFILPEKVEINTPFMNVLFANIEKYSQVIDPYTTLHNVNKKKVMELNNYVQSALGYAKAIKKLLQDNNLKGKFDVIHAHDWLCVPAAYEVKKALGIPLVVHIHATEYDRTGGHFPNEAVYEIEKSAMQEADLVISVSELTKQTLIKEYGAVPDRIQVVHNGIKETTRPDVVPALEALKRLGYQVVLFLGRITLQKGPEYYVQAAEKAIPHVRKVLFVVTGSGDMQEQMMNEVYRRKLTKHFLFTGFLRGKEKDGIFQAADVYVMPSVSEPFGLTTLEAMANQTPVIVSKQSGVSEVVAHALKVDFWDVDEMANKIASALSYQALRSSLAKEAHREVQGITWDKAADKCMSIYSTLIT